jgi:hypothetical protein
MKNIYVLNLKGEKEPFSSQKVYQSAKKAGASYKVAKKIAGKIKDIVYPGIETREIYKKVKELLKKENKTASLRFSLKEAMRKLGPSGFPFEKYIGEIYIKNNFKVKLNQNIKGEHAIHEIDFLAQKDKLLYLGECKFRHHRGERIDLKIVLAVYARFLDLKNKNCFKNFKLQPIVVTNAKFSSQAKKYAKGVGIQLLGWNYPKNKGLEKIIEEKKLYPITILPSFKGFLKELFISRLFMLAEDVFKIEIHKFSKQENIDIEKLEKLKKEALLLKNKES